MTLISQGYHEIWQHTLVGKTITAVPLKESDYDALYAVASDPKIWEMHPVPDRYTRAKFDIYFRTGMDSGGALLVINGATGDVIGSSRFTSHCRKSGTVEIGYTFLKCSHWGTGANGELKNLMLAHAFRTVEQVEFFVGAQNFRSQAAMTKMGGKQTRTVTEQEPEGDLRQSIVYSITKSEFLDSK